MVYRFFMFKKRYQSGRRYIVRRTGKRMPGIALLDKLQFFKKIFTKQPGYDILILLGGCFEWTRKRLIMKKTRAQTR